MVKKLTLFMLLALLGCKSKPEVKKNQAPKLKKKIKNIDADKKIKVMEKHQDQNPENIKFRPLKPEEKLDCHKICLQLGWCNQKVFNKNPDPRRFKICRKLCKYDKSQTGKAKNKAFRQCVDKFRGKNCLKLRKCIKNKLLDSKEKLKGKEPVNKKPLPHKK